MKETDNHEENGELKLEQLARKWLEDIRHDLGVQRVANIGASVAITIYPETQE